MNDVIVFADVELDPEGLEADLTAGYSVFEHTPVRGVRFMPPSARLWRDADGGLRARMCLSTSTGVLRTSGTPKTRRSTCFGRVCERRSRPPRPRS